MEKPKIRRPSPTLMQKGVFRSIKDMIKSYGIKVAKEGANVFTREEDYRRVVKMLD